VKTNEVIWGSCDVT